MSYLFEVDGMIALVYPVLMSSGNGIQHVQLVVSGRVQMVGFRFFALNAAEAYGITGFVRNLPNGDVEIAASGKAADLKRFAAAVKQGPPSSSVHHVCEDWNRKAGEAFKSFTIRW